MAGSNITVSVAQFAQRNTIKALERRGLISPGKGRDPLTILWRREKKID